MEGNFCDRGDRIAAFVTFPQGLCVSGPAIFHCFTADDLQGSQPLTKMETQMII